MSLTTIVLEEAIVQHSLMPMGWKEPAGEQLITQSRVIRMKLKTDFDKL